MKQVPALVASGIIAASIFALPGCGGNSGIPTKSYSLTVNWGQRVRDISAPASAQSIRMVVKAINADGTDFEMVINRPKALGPISQTYTFKAAFLSISSPVFVDFLSDFDAKGSVVANGSGTTGSGTTIEGSTITLPGISFDSKIKSLSVPTGQRFYPNTSRDLQFSATDANNSIVPVVPGACLWATDNENVMTFSRGSAQALNRGRVNVTARVDGLSSAPTAVVVMNNLASLRLNSDTQMTVGQTLALPFAAIDVDGNVLTFPVAEMLFTSSNPSILKFVDGRAVGVAPGNATVSVQFRNPDGTFAVAPSATVRVIPTVVAGT